MIALLRGTVVSAGPNEVVLDVNGVGYRVSVAGHSGVVRVGAEVVLHTHLAVREDALTLYGFAEVGARDLFETLLTVSGLGPKLALAALGTLSADGLRRAVVAEDVGALTRIPGVGRKGAQRIVLELRERLGQDATVEARASRLDEARASRLDEARASRLDEARASRLDPDQSGAMPGADDGRAQVLEALAGLGYGTAEAAAALEGLPHPPPGTPEELLRQALRSLGRGAPAAEGGRAGSREGVAERG